MINCYFAGFPEMTVSPIDAFPGFPTTLNTNLGEDVVYFDIGKNYFGKVDVVSTAIFSLMNECIY